MIRLVGFLGALIAFILPLEAHDFYDPWCCNGQDCQPYHGEVHPTADGFFLPEYNVTIPYKSASGVSRYAEEAGTRYDIPPDADDTQYYICVMPWEPMKVRCFGARPGGV